MKKAWWKENVIYQIYPRSFKDSNNDGIGDLPGIIEKLDYVERLGVDVIWLCPIYDSPNDDNGYDVRDYYTIMEEFGTMSDFDVLLEKVHQKGMKLILDLVANHTSDEHAWFVESKTSRDSDKRDFYIWKSGENGSPPNNWKSFFGGNAWQYDESTKQYYLHLFSKKQPDLNWENSKVRQEVYKMMNWWLDKGIDGFRMDVISLISKRDFEDSPHAYFAETIENKYANGPKVGAYLEEMYRESIGQYDAMTVGEGPGIGYETALDYVLEDKKRLNMIIHFDHMFLDHGKGGRFDPKPWDFVEFKRVFKRWDQLVAVGGWPAIFLGNHDFPRIVSRFGNDGEYHLLSAQALGLILLTMRGTPYIYQGDELGMTNLPFSEIDSYRDVETINAYHEAAERFDDMDKFMSSVISNGRDNARSPMQWSKDAHAGFSIAKPWIDLNPNFDKINASDQESDPNSILNFYRAAIALRKKYSTLIYGDFELLGENHPSIFAYTRKDTDGNFLIAINFAISEEELTLEGLSIQGAKPLLSNYRTSNFEVPTFKLRPWEAMILRIAP